MNKKLDQNGSHIILLVLLLTVLGAIIFVGYRVVTISKDISNSDVHWRYDDKKDVWFADQGKVPDCKQPLVFDNSPIDLNDATSIGFPGTYRGKSYKVHSTFSLSKSSHVKLPMDATLTGLSRYFEGEPAELQYVVRFENDCGIAFYFDHIYTLSPQLQEIASKLPEPKLNDTKVNPNDAPPRLKMKAGDIVATETGSHLAKRFGIDFGVIDYRKRNHVSQDPKWAALHSTYKSSEWYGVCWFDMLPNGDAQKAMQLSVVQADTRRVAKFVSDYCNDADYKTLDLSDGQPVDYY